MNRKLGLILTVCTIQVLAKPSFPDSHIVGGTAAKEDEYPYVVSLNTINNYTFCGGSILSKQYIMTAAHCLDRKPNAMLIGVGSIHLDKQKRYEVERVIRHPQYNPEATENDIGLVKLKENLEFSGSVQPIKFNYTGNLDLKNVTAVGWGQMFENGLSSEVLLYLKRWIMPNKKCNEMLAPDGAHILESNICIASEKHKGLCFGDSGSPLVYKEKDELYTVGIVSWGIPCAEGYPDVYTRVQSYIDWINEIIQK